MKKTEKSLNAYFNPNPKKQEVSDCVVRAICAITGFPWDTVYKELCEIGYAQKAMPNDSLVYSEYLRSLGFIRVPISTKKGSKRPTVNEMARNFPKGAICEVAKHLTAVKDGKVWDLWDCGKKCLYGYWVLESKLESSIPVLKRTPAIRLDTSNGGHLEISYDDKKMWTVVTSYDSRNEVITRYGVEDKDFVTMLNWYRYQKENGNEQLQFE